MLNILNSFLESKKSNLVRLIRNKFDFETYNFLRLDERVLTKINKIFEEQKNTCFKIYL
jgi:hypothetical protein